jgi:heptosyltransferase II
MLFKCSNMSSMKILINALSGIGDALMFSPALRLIKEKDPDCTADMLVMYKSVQKMYENNPYLDNIYFINFLHQSKLSSLKDVLKLRKNKYDYTLNIYPSNRLEYNIVNYFLGGKKRISHHYKHTKLLRGEFLNNVLIDEVKDRHNVLQNIDIAKRIIDVNEENAGGLEIYLKDDDVKRNKKWIDEINPDKRILIGFHAGSALLKNHVNKRWGKAKFASLGNILMKEYNAKILLFGNETKLNEEINSFMDNRGVIASTDNYMDSMARLKYCNLFVSNDTAFLHSASAFGIPIVAIFGYTNHKELFPWKTKHIIVRKKLDCSPCFYNSPRPATCIWNGDNEFKCMKLLTVEDVAVACRMLLK